MLPHAPSSLSSFSSPHSRFSPPSRSSPSLSSSLSSASSYDFCEADLGAKNSTGATPIFAAAWSGHTRNVAALIEAGADLEAPPGTPAGPLIIACACARLDACMLLVSSRADVNKSTDFGTAPLGGCSHCGDVSIMQFLLDNGADINHRFTPKTFFAQATFMGGTIAHLIRPRLVTEFVTHSNGCQALHHASLAGSAACVRLLLARRADLAARNARGKTALELARLRGHVEVEAILSADISR